MKEEALLIEIRREIMGLERMAKGGGKGGVKGRGGGKGGEQKGV